MAVEAVPLESLGSLSFDVRRPCGLVLAPQQGACFPPSFTLTADTPQRMHHRSKYSSDECSARTRARTHVGKHLLTDACLSLLYVLRVPAVLVLIRSRAAGRPSGLHHHQRRPVSLGLFEGPRGGSRDPRVEGRGSHGVPALGRSSGCRGGSRRAGVCLRPCGDQAADGVDAGGRQPAARCETNAEEARGWKNMSGGRIWLFRLGWPDRLNAQK